MTTTTWCRTGEPVGLAGLITKVIVLFIIFNILQMAGVCGWFSYPQPLAAIPVMQAVSSSTGSGVFLSQHSLPGTYGLPMVALAEKGGGNDGGSGGGSGNGGGDGGSSGGGSGSNGGNGGWSGGGSDNKDNNKYDSGGGNGGSPGNGGGNDK